VVEARAAAAEQVEIFRITPTVVGLGRMFSLRLCTEFIILMCHKL
jgi:hypothetical protein